MNAHMRFPPVAPRLADAIVTLARRFDRHPYITSPDRARCFDCIAFVNVLSGADIAEDWMQDGGRLPFETIDPPDARPGDLITFRMTWPHRPFHVALLASGRDIDDPRAQIFGPWFGHAAATCWLRAWRPHVNGAYRIVGAA